MVDCARAHKTTQAKAASNKKAFHWEKKVFNVLFSELFILCKFTAVLE